MKSKRLLSMLLAAAMVAGSMPVTVFAGRLDYEPEETEVPQITETEEEKETSKPTVKETKPEVKETEPEVKETEPEVKETEPEVKETEAPKESEAPAEQPEETIPETEAPAETEKPEAEQPKETEAPAETEKPAETTPEETDKPAEEARKVPAKDATISNVTISNGILSWDSVAGANGYDVYVNEYHSYFDVSCGTQLDLNKEIDVDIKLGLVKKTSNNTYKIKIVAIKYNSETQAEEAIGESDEISYVYKTSASEVKVVSFSGIKMSGKNLVWNKVKGAAYYNVFYDGKQTVTVNSYDIGSVIDNQIKTRIIYKSPNDKYSVYLCAFDSDDVMLAEWDGYITYKTNAAPDTLPSMTNVKISKEGILTWDAYPSATSYSARIVGANDYIFAYSDDGVTLAMNLKKSISYAIENSGFEELSSYKIELYAYDFSKEVAEVAQFNLTYKYKEVNTLSVKPKTVKAKKSKAKKKNQTFKRSKVLTVKKAVGAVTYTKVSGNAKIVINKKTGKLTVLKKIKKGTYKVRIAVSATGNATYAPITKTVTVKVKVK